MYRDDIATLDINLKQETELLKQREKEYHNIKQSCSLAEMRRSLVDPVNIKMPETKAGNQQHQERSLTAQNNQVEVEMMEDYEDLDLYMRQSKSSRPDPLRYSTFAEPGKKGSIVLNPEGQEESSPMNTSTSRKQKKSLRKSSQTQAACCTPGSKGGCLII